MNLKCLNGAIRHFVFFALFTEKLTKTVKGNNKPDKGVFEKSLVWFSFIKGEVHVFKALVQKNEIMIQGLQTWSIN